MDKRLTYTKLGAATLFGAPSMLDAALVHFDIPDTVIPAPTVSNSKTFLIADLSNQSAITVSYTAPGPPVKNVIAGSKVGFNPSLAVASKNKGGTGKSFSTVDGSVSGYPGGKPTTFTTGSKVPYPPTSVPVGASVNNFYVSGSGMYLSPYFPADNSTQYQYFQSSQAAFGWLEMSMAPNGDVTVMGAYYSPIPESSTVLAITTALAGSAFIYSRRRRKAKAVEQVQAGA